MLSAVVLIALALALDADNAKAATAIGAVGVLAGLGAVALVAQRLHLVRADQLQCTFCGCGCAISLIGVPLGALALWSQGGPVLAALAIPAWLPVSLALSWAPHAGDLLVRKLGRATSRAAGSGRVAQRHAYRDATPSDGSRRVPGPGQLRSHRAR